MFQLESNQSFTGLELENLREIGSNSVPNPCKPSYSETDESCKISAGPIPKLFVVDVIVRLVIVFVFMIILIIWELLEPNPAGFILALICGFIITLQIILARDLFKYAKELQAGPLLEFEVHNNTIKILNCKHVVPLDCIVCIVFLHRSSMNENHSNAVSEIQIYAQDINNSSKSLVDSLIVRFPDSYMQPLEKFSRRTGVRVFSVKPNFVGLKNSTRIISEL